MAEREGIVIIRDLESGELLFRGTKEKAREVFNINYRFGMENRIVALSDGREVSLTFTTSAKKINKEEYIGDIDPDIQIIRKIENETFYKFAKVIKLDTQEVVAKGKEHTIFKELKIDPNTKKTYKGHYYIEGWGECFIKRLEAGEIVSYGLDYEVYTDIEQDGFIKEKSRAWKLNGACSGNPSTIYTLLDENKEPILRKPVTLFSKLTGISEEDLASAKEGAITEITDCKGNKKLVLKPLRKSYHYNARTQSAVDTYKIAERDYIKELKTTRRRQNFKLEKGKLYNVITGLEKEEGLTYVGMDQCKLLFKHKRGYMVTFPKHKALTEIERV